jgi:hypothetical protein
MTKLTLKEWTARYNDVAEELDLPQVRRFASRAAFDKRWRKLPWVERERYGRTAKTEPKHALRMSKAQRKAFHAEVCEVFASGGSTAVMATWPNVSRKVLAGHIRIAADSTPGP